MASDSKPKKMLIGGIALMVIATIAGIGFFALSLSRLAGVASKLENAQSVDLPGSAQVNGSGSSLSVWSDSSLASCSVADSSGSSVPFDSSNGTNESVSVNDASYNIVGGFDTESGQVYTVNCDGPAGSSFTVIEFSIGDMIAAAFMLLGSLVGGFGLFIIGLIFTIIALFRRSSWKKAHAGPPPGYGAPPPGGYTAPTPAGTPPPPGAPMQPPGAPMQPPGAPMPPPGTAPQPGWPQPGQPQPGPQPQPQPQPGQSQPGQQRPDLPPPANPAPPPPPPGS